jgi:hypothetical protein
VYRVLRYIRQGWIGRAMLMNPLAELCASDAPELQNGVANVDRAQRIGYRLECCRRLLDLGVSAVAIDHQGRCPLVLAAIGGQVMAIFVTFVLGLIQYTCMLFSLSRSCFPLANEDVALHGAVLRWSHLVDYHPDPSFPVSQHELLSMMLASVPLLALQSELPCYRYL